MSIIALDLGGTKLAYALFNAAGVLSHRGSVPLPAARGGAVGKLMEDTVRSLMELQLTGDPVTGVGVAVPGIYRSRSETVWAPNIPGWDDYPLAQQLQAVDEGLHVVIDSDRACCILGEVWRGSARGCTDAIFLTVGTGIGAGILAGGQVLRGAADIAGAIGWMALDRPYRKEYDACGCFERYASGDGIAKTARALLASDPAYGGALGARPLSELTAHHVFAAHQQGDPMAKQALDHAIELWGMATANLVSIFNPEKILFGGGVFGPGAVFIDRIRAEAAQWAQPLSMQQVQLEVAGLGADAALYGAAYLVCHPPNR